MKLIGLTRSERQFVNDCMTHRKWDFQLKGAPVPKWFSEKYDIVSRRTHGNKNIKVEGDGMWKPWSETTPSTPGMYLVTLDVFGRRSTEAVYWKDTEEWSLYICTENARIVAWTEMISPFTED